jgi:hypothetical protein
MQKTVGGMGSIIGTRFSGRGAGAQRRAAACTLSYSAVVLVAVSLWNGAAAQTVAPAPVGTQPLPAREEPDNRPTTAREAENYNPRGVRLGSFLLFPELEADQVLNDNIYATSAATGRTASFIEVVKPTLELKSQWSNHMLNFFARGGFGFYTTDPSQNFQDFSVGADGRLDIMREWNVYGGGSFSRKHEELGTPNTVTGASQPAVYNQIAGNVGYYQRFGSRFKVRADGRLDNYNYLNSAGGGPSQGILFGSDRNRTEFRESLRLAYEFLPGYEIWTRGGLNQRRYDNNPDSTGVFRNSSGWDVVGGIAIDFGGITSLEAFAGFIEQNYVDPQFQTIRVPTFGLTGYWNPLRELTVRPFVRRTIDDTSLTNAAAYINTSGGVDVAYNWRPNIRLDGHADYSVADYQALSGTAGRYDQYYTFRAGLMYLITPNFFVGPSYQFVHRTSNQFNSDYDQNLITLRLGARL